MSGHDSNLGDEGAERRRLRRATRRGFLGLGVGAAAAAAGVHWLTTRPEIGGRSYPLRDALELNEGLARRYFSDARLAPTFPREMARDPRVNGTEGFDDSFDPRAWELEVIGVGSRRTVTLAELQRLPRVEMTTELKCIEGWSVVVHWAGVRLRDFAVAHGVRAAIANDGHDPAGYVSLSTPGGGYHVGLDMASALHPQTLLCDEMNGRPLSIGHGAPLRLVTTVKYGIKSIKRVGTIAFTAERPADFWAERGYDWYAGL